MHVTPGPTVELESNTATRRFGPESVDTPFARVLDTAVDDADSRPVTEKPGVDSRHEDVREPKATETEATETETETETTERAEAEDSVSDDSASEQPTRSDDDAEPTPSEKSKHDSSDSRDATVDIARELAGVDVNLLLALTQKAGSTGSSNPADGATASLTDGKAQAPLDGAKAVAVQPTVDSTATPPGQSAAPTKPEAAAPPPGPPRFTNAHTAQVAESARSSIFRQIAVKLTPEGGKMRVLLSPPELGQLDLRMIVDKAGAMRLHIVADRPEVTRVLEHHLGELRTTLSEQGVTVSEASIQSGSQGSANESFGDGSFGRDSFGFEVPDELDGDESTPRHTGFITGEGLNFLV